MSAAFDRFAAAEAEDAADADTAAELETRERAFVALSDRLHDIGVQGGAIRAWEKARHAAPRLTLH
jgi:hypothetical protein